MPYRQKYAANSHEASVTSVLQSPVCGWALLRQRQEVDPCGRGEDLGEALAGVGAVEVEPKDLVAQAGQEVVYLVGRRAVVVGRAEAVLEGDRGAGLVQGAK